MTIGISMLVLAQAAAPAGAVAPAPSAAAPTSVQAMFETATAAADRSDHAAAERGFAALEQRLAGKNAQSLALVRLRLGIALFGLGRFDEAETKLRDGLAAVKADDASLIDDRFTAQLALGQIALRRNEGASAVPVLNAARVLAAKPWQQAEAESALAQAKLFDPGDDAVGHAQEAVRLVEGDPLVTDASRARYLTILGRAQLNHGQTKAARATLQQATKKLGGSTTMRVDRADIVARSDLALAALLDGDKEEAKRLLAYTGAGRLKTSFEIGADMELPACGGPEQIRPDDVVVVEFGIADDGRVVGSSPIYASRLGPIGAAFARQVSTWSWKPGELAKIPVLFRATTRIELRCSNATSRVPIRDALRIDYEKWIEGRAAPAEPGSQAASALPRLRAELDRRATPIAKLPVLLAIAENPVSDREGKADALRTALAIVEAEKANMPTIVFFATSLYLNGGPRRGAALPNLAELAARADVAADSRARTAVRLLQAEELRLRDKPKAIALLIAVRDDPALAANDPLRVGGLVRLAALEAERGDLAAARSAFDATGLSAQQCALVDAVPALARQGVGTQDFPQDALSWGFEGWIKLQFDIDAAGHTVGTRAIASYPPFVFSPAAATILRHTRYTQSYRPDGGMGCGSAAVNINFRLPK